MSDEATLKEQIEKAKADPAWKKVLEFTENAPQLKILFFSGRLVDLLVFTEEMLQLRRAGKEHIIKQKMLSVPELVTNSEYLNFDRVQSDEERKAWVDYFIGEMEERFREKIEQYDFWLLNQTLVMFCTVMDAFLESLVDNVLRQNVRILYGAAGAKSIELKHAVELGSLDAIIAEFQQKEIRNFSYGEIEERFNYIESRLGIPKEDVFDWRTKTPEGKEQLKGWDLNTLKNIYQKRHSVVHRDALPIKTLHELSKISDFLSSIIFNLGFLVSKKHKVQMDMTLIMNKLEIYRQLKSQ